MLSAHNVPVGTGHVPTMRAQDKARGESESEREREVGERERGFME